MSMKNTEHLVNDWAPIEQVNSPEQDILKTIGNTSEVPYKIYETLPDIQKIAVILAGGAPALFECQQMRTDSNTETGQLPILC